jgi:hypothetical protein
VARRGRGRHARLGRALRRLRRRGRLARRRVLARDLGVTPDWQDEDAAKAAYERHNDEVRAAVPADRLLEWRPGDGWEPICSALDVPVPAEPFPHVNTTADFRAMAGFDQPP